MSRRSKNQKKQRFALIVTLVLIVLLIVMIKSISGNTKQQTDIDTTKPVQNVETEQTKNTSKDEITKIEISPSIYTAKTSEIIDISNFKIESIYKSGKKEELNDDITFLTDSNLLNIDDDTICVSKKALTADSAILEVNYKEYSTDITVKILNNLKDNIDENGVITNPTAYDMVVNKTRYLSSSYVPEDLVPLDDIPKSLKNPEVNQLRKVAYEALIELFSAAKIEKSFDLYARSGYRSYNTQVSLYGSYAAKNGQEAADKFSARPGQSEHQSGLAMDITCLAMNYQLDTTFGDKEEGKWVAENAHKFGFVIRYPKGKEDITGYQYEPWHLRYVGPSLAKEIYESQLTLEEYLKQ